MGFQFYPVMFSTKLWSAAIVLQFPQRVSERRQYVYHYTTGEGLKGIVESKSLWATGAYYLNDTSEIEYGCRLAARVLEESFAAAETAFAGAVLREAHTILSDPAQREVRTTTLYVACFCEGDNLLSQWRTYSRSGGFALGFRVADLERLQPEPTTVSLRKVLYAKEDQIKLVRDLIGAAITVLRDDDVVRGPNNWVSISGSIEAGGEVARMLLSAITCFKAPDFAEEHEWRLVCQPFHADESERIEAVRQIARFRASSRGLVPYIQLTYPPMHPSAGTLPIDSVRFGPTQAPDLAKCVTRMLLDANGLRSAKVDGSEISVMLDG